MAYGLHRCRGEYVITIDPAVSAAVAWGRVRDQRNALLAASDWTDTFSAPTRLGHETYKAWQTYRQALRDITAQDDPNNITWPTAPSEEA